MNIESYGSNGVIFDARYTESFLRFIAPRLYSQSVHTPVPDREILLSLVLNGRIFLADPTWLSPALPNELGPLVEEGLVDFVPSGAYDIGLSNVQQISRRLTTEERTSAAPVWISMDSQGRIDEADWKSAEYDRELEEIEAAHDAEVALRQLAGVEPLINPMFSSLSSVPLEQLEIGLDELFVDWGGDDLTPYDLLNTNSSYSDLKGRGTAGSFARWLSTERRTSKPTGENERWREVIVKQQAWAYDSALAAFALDTFASKTGFPVQADTPRNLQPTLKPAFSHEAEQILRIQFEKLRYPVIETMDDVRRLRDSEHFEQYREVIAEFSQRLGTEIEADGSSVLEEFRARLQSTIEGLAAARKWEQRSTLPFYLRVALAGLGSFVPGSDFVISEMWQRSAQFFARRATRGKQWLLLGRPDY